MPKLPTEAAKASAALPAIAGASSGRTMRRRMRPRGNPGNARGIDEIARHQRQPRAHGQNTSGIASMPSSSATPGAGVENPARLRQHEAGELDPGQRHDLRRDEERRQKRKDGSARRRAGRRATKSARPAPSPTAIAVAPSDAASVFQKARWIAREPQASTRLPKPRRRRRPQDRATGGAEAATCRSARRRGEGRRQHRLRPQSRAGRAAAPGGGLEGCGAVSHPKRSEKRALRSASSSTSLAESVASTRSVFGSG